MDVGTPPVTDAQSVKLVEGKRERVELKPSTARHHSIKARSNQVGEQGS